MTERLKLAAVLVCTYVMLLGAVAIDLGWVALPWH